jgi:hypothetical protein
MRRTTAKGERVQFVFSKEADVKADGLSHDVRNTHHASPITEVLIKTRVQHDCFRERP